MAVRNDPLHIFGFTCAHLVVFTVIFVYIVPRSMDILVPAKRREEGVRAYAPQVLCGLDDIRVSEGIEAGVSSQDSDSDAEKKNGKPHGMSLNTDDTGKDESTTYHTIR